MVKYFCDICGKEVRCGYNLDAVKIIIESPYNIIYYSACGNCRKNLNEHILKIQEESKNGNT